MEIVYVTFGVVYFLIGCLYYYHNRMMGTAFTGVIMACLWFIVAIMWCWGYYLVWDEDRELKRIINNE